VADVRVTEATEPDLASTPTITTSTTATATTAATVGDGANSSLLPSTAMSRDGSTSAATSATSKNSEAAPVVAAISKAVDFSVADEDIVFMDGSTTLVKAATFSKLIERLTCPTDYIGMRCFVLFVLFVWSNLVTVSFLRS
jgi:hypothetical protein